MPVPQDSFFVVERASWLWNGHLGCGTGKMPVPRQSLEVNIFLLPSSFYYRIKDSLHDDTNSTKNTNL